jgi:tetratricopeptide (TPR) repeat protein
LAPAFALTYLERGACYALAEDSTSAIADFDRAIALLAPCLEQAIAYCNRGCAYDALGDFQAALADIRRAIETAPEFTPAYAERERVQARAKSAGVELRALPAMKPDPEVAAQYCEQGWADDARDALVDALVHFGRAIDCCPNYANAYYGRGVVNCKLGRHEHAIEDLNRALDLEPKFPAALAERGLANVELGNFRKGMRDYNRAIAIDDTYAMAHVNKGSAYALQSRWTEAVACLDEGIKLDPEIPEAYFNRAAALDQLQEYQRSLEDLRVYLRLQPDGPLADSVRERLPELEERLKRQ